MPIYKQYDQQELNRQYNNRLQVPHHSIHTNRWDIISKQTEEEFTSIQDIAYGELAKQRLDIYPSSKPKSKTLVFIHGGYWRSMDKKSFHFVAKAFHDYDITTVLITYPLAPEFSMSQIVFSCRKAIRWVHENISEYNGDPGQIYLAGHSAGGHLAAMMMTEDAEYPNRFIKGVCTLSGLFNLLPVQLSEVNETLQMDKSMALKNSPVQLQTALHCPLLITVGADETEEYLAQSNELFERWKGFIPAELLVLKTLNHYSIIEDLLNADSTLHKKICGLMGI